MVKISVDSPELYEKFKAHLEEGWSISLFRKCLTHKDYAYFTKVVMKESKFAELGKKYTRIKGYINFLREDTNV